MMTLVVGGSASGKSAWAEELAARSPGRPRLYIATMEPYDEECLQRIDRHRRIRAGRGFETLECYRDLQSLAVPAGSTALLECMGNLCANELFRPGATPASALEAVLRGADALRRQCGELIVVSNEVFSGGSQYGEGTLEYLRLLGEVNRTLAAWADSVCEVSCGIPIYHKGGERC